MTIASVLLVAASVSAVLGDFDHDGRVDRAYVRQAGEAYELVIDRGSGATVVIEPLANLRHFYLSELAPGTYRAACAKGLGGSDGPCPVPAVRLDRPALQFGAEEASQAALFWDRDRFRVVWLSD